VAYVVSSRRSQELASSAINLPMRGLVEGLPTPHPLVAMLPSALQEDDFCTRMVSALDDVLAPIFSTLDCFPAYLDPALAPDDFVDWLASWVGVDIDETWTLERRRRLIQEAVALYRVRGTAAGLAAHIRLYAGATPEIEESGGCAWSQTADSALPGSPEFRVTVRLRVDDDSGLRRTTVARIVDAARPAHVPYHLEIVVGGTTIAGEEAPEGGAAADAPGAVALPGSDTIELAAQGPVSEEEEEGLDVRTDPAGDSPAPEPDGAEPPRTRKPSGRKSTGPAAGDGVATEKPETSGTPGDGAAPDADQPGD